MFSSKFFLVFLLCSSAVVVNSELSIKTKEDWNGEPAEQELDDLKLPVNKVIICHTASETCNDEEACEDRVKQIQKFHLYTFHFSDIGYNFLIGNNGIIYEGRGWRKLGAHTRSFNTGSIGIAFVGTFDKVPPSEAALNATQALIADGVDKGMLSSDYKLYGHRQLTSTSSPGDALYSLIKKWPNWSRRLH